MAEPFLGEIRLMGFNYPPRGWALCDGTILEINQYAALYSLIGNIYGGDGRTTFALPDLRGRVPVHSGPVLAEGTRVGLERVTLQVSEQPAHTHRCQVTSDSDATNVPSGIVQPAETESIYTADETSPVNMNNTILTQFGGNESHENTQPSLVLNFCIALEGIFPPRS